MNKYKILFLIVTIYISTISAYANIDHLDKNKSTTYLGVVKMSSQMLDNNIIKLQITAEDFKKSVLGIAFHLNFNTKNYSFLKYEPGNFLETGGDPLYLVSTNSGKIIFGETLNNNAKFPTGNGIITTMFFQKNNNSTFTPTFSNGVISTLDIVRQDLDPILWNTLDDYTVFKPTSKSNLTNYRKTIKKNKKLNIKYLYIIMPPFFLLTILLMLRYVKKQKRKQ